MPISPQSMVVCTSKQVILVQILNENRRFSKIRQPESQEAVARTDWASNVAVLSSRLCSHAIAHLYPIALFSET